MRRIGLSKSYKYFLTKIAETCNDDFETPWDTYPCLIWEISSDSNGYGVLQYERRQIRAHRLALMVKLNDFNTPYFACHHCDNPRCFRPAHIFPGTQADNMRDMDNKGRRPPKKPQLGIENHKAVLSEQQVIEIRSLAGIRSQNELARQFSVSKSAIKHILHRRSWTHI